MEANKNYIPSSDRTRKEYAYVLLKEYRRFVCEPIQRAIEEPFIIRSDQAAGYLKAHPHQILQESYSEEQRGVTAR